LENKKTTVNDTLSREQLGTIRFRVMRAELKAMNRDVEKIRDTLQKIANLAIDSANLLKDVDSALGTGIKNVSNARKIFSNTY